MSFVTPFVRSIVRPVSAVLVGALVLLPTAPQAQEEERVVGAPNEKVVEQVTAAFKAADCDALLGLAVGRLEIDLLGQRARYSRGQAALVLRDFFRRYPPSDVVLSERSTAGDERAAMGRYWSANSSGPFVLYVGFRVGDEEAWRLESIRIERGSFQRASLHGGRP